MPKMDEVSSDELYNGQVSIFNGTGKWDYYNGGMIYYGHNNPDNYQVFGHSDTEDGKHKITVGPDGHSEITTVENAQNALGVHEFVAHGKKGVSGGETKAHAKAYEMQMAHPTWRGTTPQFRKDMTDRYNKYLNY